jgi:hypothetical protein
MYFQLKIANHINSRFSSLLSALPLTLLAIETSLVYLISIAQAVYKALISVALINHQS